MLLDFEKEVADRDLHITGVLHIGAHLGEEAEIYARLGIDHVVWVEANSDNLPAIAAKVRPYGHFLIEALIADTIGIEREFHITNYDSMSSSLFEFGTHTRFSPDTVFVEHRKLRTTTIDHLIATSTNPRRFDGINTLVMDIQGAELLALKGATKFLEQVDYVYCEVNTDDVYVGCAKLDELSAFLGTEPVAISIVPQQGWGDALFILEDGC